jgi:tricarboxylate carrier
MTETVDLSKNLYDMTTYNGRASHFYRSVNPLNLFKDHVSARDVVRKVQADGGVIPPGMTREDVWNAKYIYDSAYHPTTGELVFMPGRMSFQAPGNCIIASGMIIFYKTPLQNILGQLVNQSFNSTVNYSNAPVPKFVPQDFAVAAGSACAAAYGMNKMASRFAIPLLARLVPFAAVCVANGINLPYMRRDEIISGMPLEDENGNVVGHSPKIGKEAIIKVVLCRILMATPTMVVPPIVIESLSKPGKLLTKNPALKNPLQVLLVGLSLVFATPAACAIWPQRDSTSVESLEPDVRDKLKAQGISTVYFNKGL